MIEIINLKQKRKQKARADKEAKAVENRYTHGRTKEQKKADKYRSEKDKKHIESHKIGKD